MPKRCIRWEGSHLAWSVEYHDIGSSAKGPFKTGDFLLIEGGVNFFSPLIRFGQTVRMFLRATKHWNWGYWKKAKSLAKYTHVAPLYGEDGTTSESVETGVRFRHIDDYKNKRYALVRTSASTEQRRLMKAFADDVMGSRSNRYDYFSVIVLIPIQIITAGKWAFARASTYFCSGFMAEQTVKTLPSYPRPPVGMLPFEVAEFYDV